MFPSKILSGSGEKNDEKSHEYEKNMTGNMREKLEIAKIFKENMKIKENKLGLSWAKLISSLANYT